MQDTIVKNAILIAGPTASGKSAMATDLAVREGGVVINADSMQVYGVLNILTARPPAADLARSPHFLFGHVDPAKHYSTGAWLQDVSRVLEDELQGRRPVFVGGTGLYFKALLGGLSEMPAVPSAVRERWRCRLAEEGAAKLHRILRAEDPTAALAIGAGDGQRIVRALEVLEATGKPISKWQGQHGAPLIDLPTATCLALEPERSWLRARIAARFSSMVEEGALEEAQAMRARALDPSLPAMKAIGVRELIAHLEGKLALDEALSLAVTATRQYAKRQSTWFRNQLDAGWERVAVPPPQ